jgi:DNA repair photolyase
LPEKAAVSFLHYGRSNTSWLINLFLDGEIWVDKKADVRGTREWAVAEINCSRGCPHGCRYCYARYDQVIRKQLVTESDWANCCDLPGEIDKNRSLYDGQVMFPAAHDIIPDNIESCVKVLDKLLAAGNKVLIVSKPHLECIQRLCREFYDCRDHILFRFTVTARNAEILSFWEPGAPAYQERLMSLRSCYERGFATSVSIEPMLHREDVVQMVYELLPYVSHSIWIGKMNRIDTRVSRVGEVGEQFDKEIERITLGQSDQELRLLYKELEHVDKIRWKESVKEVLGLPLASEAGLDL